MPLMFESIIFDLNPYFGFSATFVYFILHLWICYAARCVHFTVTSGTRRALFFLWEQMDTSRSTFIRKIKPVVRHHMSMLRKNIKKKKKKNCKTNYFIIGPPSNWTHFINNFNKVYYKRNNSTKQKRN